MCTMVLTISGYTFYFPAAFCEMLSQDFPLAQGGASGSEALTGDWTLLP